MQNVGTTTWDATYDTLLTAGEPAVAVRAGTGLGPAGPARRHRRRDVHTATWAAGRGTEPAVLAMRRNGSPFGAAWLAQVTLVDIAASAIVPESALLGTMLEVPILVSGTQPMTVTPGFELRDTQGSLVDSSVLVARRYGTPRRASCP